VTFSEGRVRTRIGCAGIAVVLACLTSWLPGQAQTGPGSSSDTRTVIDLINRARILAGVDPVADSPELDAAAQAHSVDMVQHNYLDHTGFDGSEPQQRADAAGYHVPPQTGWIVVEVISARGPGPDGPVNWWLGDRQHNRVLLNPRWREIGAGYAQGGDYGNYWTADFGCRPGVLATVSVDGMAYPQTEQCGDPSVAPVVVAPTPTTLVAAPTPTMLVGVPTPTAPLATPTSTPSPR
jgi:uncharacterized protein YkwD